MDPGGGNWLRRRPGSLFLRLLFHIVLLLSHPSSTSFRRIAGDSVTMARDHLHSPPVSPSVSMARAQGESPLAKADGSFGFSRFRTKLSNQSMQISNPPPVSVGPLSPILCISETSTLPRFGFDELWSHDSQRVYYHIQLRQLCFWASTCSFLPTPVVCHSQDLRIFPHIGNCNHHLCLPSLDRYNFLRPIIPNIMTKFLVDGGVSVHEIDGGPDFVGIVVLSFDLCYRKQGDVYHRLMVLLTGPHASVLFSSQALEVSLNDLSCFEIAKPYKSRSCNEVKPETYRKSEESLTAALSLAENLGRTAHVGLGPVYAINGLYYQKGLNPSIKNIQKKNHRTDLGFKFGYRASVVCFKSDIFCNVGLLTCKRESLDSLNLIM